MLPRSRAPTKYAPHQAASLATGHGRQRNNNSTGALSASQDRAVDRFTRARSRRELLRKRAALAAAPAAARPRVRPHRG
eukprot:scaffold2183_cov55-Phaeocystis_antarctica.AAC.3